ncbi:MAG: tRNA guanosine(34) transglycosylase Tgt, partial [Paracoccus sp. (in: a-proteobacteria)]
MSDRFSFSLHASDGAARSGTIHTPRGEIRTPAFMPVGTAATVKAMMPESVRKTGADILLGNTYHLMLRPGAERIAGLGGLHRFMNWPRPILTDSGGFQVMSLSSLRKLTEEGVTFASHIDGSRHHLTPERSMEIQHLLGSDIVMAFDECPALPAAERDVAVSMRLSMRWARRSRDAFGDRPGHALFGIMQGGVTRDLREESAQALTGIGFDGYAIGGLAVGEGQQAMFGVLDYAPGFLPADRRRYLMGVGQPDDLVGAVTTGGVHGIWWIRPLPGFNAVVTVAGRHPPELPEGGQVVAVDLEGRELWRFETARGRERRAVDRMASAVGVLGARGDVGPAVCVLHWQQYVRFRREKRR